jgi:site-specific DNA-methyltransferase (adenine-specific)
MKEVFFDNGYIQQGDCLELMKDIPNGSIDMILADLPYNVTQNDWDSLIPLDKLWKEYKRIVKESGAIVLTAQTPFDKILGCSNLKMLKYEWIWRKSRPTGHLNANKMPMKAHENILVFYVKPPTFNKQMTIGKPNHVKDGSIRKSKATNNNYGHFENVVQKSTNLKNPITVLEFSQQDPNKILHPTQKPVALFEYLIKTYTNEGEIVLDNTAGSMTTAIAAINTDRQFICMEKDENYFEVGKNRIENHIRP